MRSVMNCPHCQQVIVLKVPMTERQKQILDFYLDFIGRRGFAPSYAMIARHVGVSSKATIAGHMAALRRQGFFEQSGAS